MFKLVRESLQPQHFQRGLDPKEAMGIGKRAKIKAWLDEMGVRNYTINDDYTIDVDGYVDLDSRNIHKFPDYIQFGKINGVFSCSHNKLTSLRGCPKYVKGYFSCDHNHLTSLEGAPKSVGGGFSCYQNKLTSLEEAPEYVGWNFWCYKNDKEFTEEGVRSVCKVEGSVYV